jgi:hypothetical protein
VGFTHVGCFFWGGGGIGGVGASPNDKKVIHGLKFYYKSIREIFNDK